MADLAQISRLRDAGIDVGRPRDVKHILTFEASETAETASELLRAAGQVVTVSRATEGSGWWVGVSARHEIDLEHISFMRSALGRYARDFGGAYLGWGPGGDPEVKERDTD